MRRLLVLTLAAFAGACSRAAETQPPRPPGPRISVYTEPAPVVAVAATGATVFTGTALGIDRWDLGSGKRTRLDAAAGVAGGPVRALALDGGGHLWFVTAGGAGRIVLETDLVENMPPPPAPLATIPGSALAIAPDRNGGAWIGAREGLFRVGPDGWQPTQLHREVTALHLAVDGTLWIGTRDGLIERNAGGVLTPARDDNTLASVSAIADGPDGALVAAGKDGLGENRIAVLQGRAFTTYRLSVDATVSAAAGGRDALILVTSAGPLALVLPESGLVGLHRNGIQLLHVAGKRKRPPYAVGRVGEGVSREITSIAAAGELTYFGTRSLGTARVNTSRGGAVTHLRARELVAGARGLSVACASAKECYLATSGSASWRFDGHGFAPLYRGSRPIISLAFVRSPQGELLTLYREPSERRLHVATLDKGVFTPKTDLVVETPSGATLLSFAKFAPDGLLWLGLQYIDEDNDQRPYGVALVNLDLAAVSYHREADQKVGVLPVPNDVVDVAFRGDETWFASGSGAARLRGDSLQVWTEADALKSEILHGVVATPAGHVLVASSSGVGEFDGARWTYPRRLAVVTHAIAGGPDGRVWLGTERGLIVYKDGKSSRYDRRAGLLDDRVFDVVVDELGRVWTRGTESVSLVVP